MKPIIIFYPPIDNFNLNNYTLKCVFKNNKLYNIKDVFKPKFNVYVNNDNVNEINIGRMIQLFNNLELGDDEIIDTQLLQEIIIEEKIVEHSKIIKLEPEIEDIEPEIENINETFINYERELITDVENDIDLFKIKSISLITNTHEYKIKTFNDIKYNMKRIKMFSIFNLEQNLYFNYACIVIKIEIENNKQNSKIKLFSNNIDIINNVFEYLLVESDKILKFIS